jgi:hypothetical protein
MRRSVIRLAGVLAVTAALVAAMTAPAFAGFGSGGNFPPSLQPGECAFTIGTSGHFFVAVGTGSTNLPSGSHVQSIGNVLVIGPLMSLPDQFSNGQCTFVPTT